MKYLFDEEHQTPEGMVSVSQLQTYMSCPKKWEYNYIEGLKPRVDRAYLTIGKLCHKGMQVAMQSAWKDQQSGLCKDYYTTNMWRDWMQDGLEAIEKEATKYIEFTPLLTEEIPDINQIMIDALSIFEQAFEEFEPWKYEIVTVGDRPALELHFVVPCDNTAGLHGYIDAILKDKETGYIWCVDYKFRKSLSPDEDEAFNIQNAVYDNACGYLGILITGTMTWQHINTPASEPTLLKNGKISTAKIKTTWNKYKEFCIANGQDPNDYTDMIEKLSGIEFFRATYEYRNSATITKMWEDVIVPVAELVSLSRNPVFHNEVKFRRSLYPWNCKMCQYKDLCQAELRSHDADFIRKTQFTYHEHVMTKK